MKISEKLKTHSGFLRQEAKRQSLNYIVAGFGVVAGLAWNEAIKSLIEFLYPLQQDTLLAKLIYAVTITLLLVFVSSYLMRPPTGKEQK